MSAIVAGAEPKRVQGQPGRPGLTPVRTAPRSHAPRAPFVVTVLLLLMGGLGALLLLNTLLAQGSFTVHDLDIRVAALKDKEQALQQKVAALAAPGRLAKRASEIGMVPAPNPAFIRSSDGKILGEPQVAPQQYIAPVIPPPVPSQNEQPATDGDRDDTKRQQQPAEQGNAEQSQSQNGQPGGPGNADSANADSANADSGNADSGGGRGENN